MISEEAEKVLNEIIENEVNSDYWKNRFGDSSNKEDAVLMGCFDELKEAELIKIQWGDGYPYLIQILKDGYLYFEKKNQEKRVVLTKFEQELNDLLDRTENIKSPMHNAHLGIDINKFNQPSEEWMNDVEIFYNRYLKAHSLSSRISTLLYHRKYDQLVSCLKSISKDQEFIEKTRGIEKITVSEYYVNTFPEYDVFLSHASKDKADIVEELNISLEKLGIKIFYDRKSLEWGDNWKERILEGVRKAEFAIIVISENFFDREWTEKELNKFLNRQNRNGQKLILPIVHNITNDDLRNKYPNVADIQAINSKDFSCDEIALLFARQLIKRLKAQA